MKRIISTLLVCVLLLGCVFTLASCGKMLSGKYEASISDENKTTYEFSMNKVTKTTSIGAFGFAKTTTTEGKYKITENDEGKLKITFTWEVDGAEESETFNFDKVETSDSEYIELNGIKFTKVD
ncbi:MAG: hypothetical protein IJY23_09155 [Clostridia bacterium]|nr:hypothetical protein [Clostridia bacterium]